MSAERSRLRLDVASGFEDLRDTWTQLAERSGNLFATWEWATVWWRHYGAGREPLLTTCRDPTGAIVAILPLYLAFGRPARVARFIGHGAADQLGPVCAPDTPGIGVALAGSGPNVGWDVLLAERLPGGTECARLPGGVQLAREPSPVIAIDGTTWDDYLAARSSNFRSQVRRKERKLLREHGLSYRLSDDPEHLDQDLDALFALHRARWGNAGSGALEGKRDAFHRDFARLALERGWLRLWMAEVEGRPIAAWYGFRFGGADWYYQFGRDPRWERSSIGLVLLAHTIRDAVFDGQREYRLLRGGEAYKDRFATGDDGLETVAVGRTTRGRLALVAARGGLALPDPLRRRLTRAVR